jgi:hypothetical protein
LFENANDQVSDSGLRKQASFIGAGRKITLRKLLEHGSSILDGMSSDISSEFRPFSTGKEQNVGWNPLEKFVDISSGILLSCPSNFPEFSCRNR